ncbi:MAG: hypothetical protein CL946_04760 [Ectothiorhodospiraceae bacterium]|nr:hypothetical protein [Ectothiorhodospiraceae bacterium]|tara:strand:+ start:128 stop:709 length:582 start_codon:yes stop_codon:yes gene_type:complete
MEEYRLVIKVKNNLLKALMDSKGIESQAELARAINVSPKSIGDVANLKVGAFNLDGTPSKLTKSLCDYFCCLPEDIYPKEVIMVGIPSNVLERVVSSEEVQRCLSYVEQDPSMLVQDEKSTEYIKNELKRLTGMQKKVIEMRFFEEKNLQECAEEVGVTRERIRQIELKAIKKLKCFASIDGSALSELNEHSQ